MCIGFAECSLHQEQMLSSLGQTHTQYAWDLDFGKTLCIMYHDDADMLMAFHVINESSLG